MAQLVTGRMPFLSSNSLSSSFLYLPHCSLHTSSPISQRMQKQYTYKIVQKINFRFTNMKPISLEWVSDYNMHHDTDIWPCCKVSHYAHTHTHTHTHTSLIHIIYAQPMSNLFHTAVNKADIQWNVKKWEDGKCGPAEKLVPSSAKNGRTVVWYQTNDNLQWHSRRTCQHTMIMTWYACASNDCHHKHNIFTRLIGSVSILCCNKQWRRLFFNMWSKNGFDNFWCRES